MLKTTLLTSLDISEPVRLFNMIATPVVLVHLETQQVVFLNHAAEELSGYILDPEKEFAFSELFMPAYSKSISAIVELAQKQEHSFMMRENDIEIRRKAGRAHPVNVSVAQMTWAGQSFLTVNLEDLGEVKKKERERQLLLERTAHDSKLIDIGRLAAGMAHELNNPLGILLGYVENIEALIEDKAITPESLKKNMVPVRQASLRMSKIISKMMARIRSQTVKMEDCSLYRIVQETLVILQEVVASHSIELKIDVKDQWVHCDASQVEQIVTNIVMNAFHALEDRKEDRQICIRSHERGPMTVLEIWNNGVPMPEKIQSQVFTPFFTTKNTGEGTGLGLYMSFNIMKSLGGELSFKSDETHGTSFYLNFPTIQKVTAPAPADKTRVLILDDDLFFRKILKSKLEKLDVVCVEGHDGKEGLSLLEKSQPGFDLVIVDIQMPKMNGIEFLSVACKKFPQVQFAMISGTTPVGDLFQQMREFGIEEALSKPLRNIELVDLLDKVHRKNHKKSAA